MGTLSWWSCQSPVAHSCGLLTHGNGSCGGMFKLNTKFDAVSLLYSLILNVMATQNTCSLNGLYHPHWLVQWSHHCSHMHIPVHSPWLPGYIDVVQTVLIILTMAGLFPDRPHISPHSFPKSGIQEWVSWIVWLILLWNYSQGIGCNILKAWLGWKVCSQDGSPTCLLAGGLGSSPGCLGVFMTWTSFTHMSDLSAWVKRKP